MKFLKKRKAKNSLRGIYLQDKELMKTLFKPGTFYKYIIDTKRKRLLIVPADKGNTVSYRAIKEGYKPVLDIRNREALRIFEGMDHLEVEIFEDKVIVRGFEFEEQAQGEAEETTVLNKIKKAGQKVLSKVANVVDITKRLKVKRQCEVVLSKKQLEQVVGGSFQQLSLFDQFEADLKVASDTVSEMKDVFVNAKIPLKVVSLFSGAGIMDIAFKQQGFEIVYALEYDKDAAETYRHNLGDHIVNEDIRNIDFEELAKIEAPVWIGGTPCQGNSAANRKTNSPDNQNNLLLNSFLKAVKKSKHCLVALIENTPGILTIGNGQFKNLILDTLSDFKINYGVLNAVDFGTAQRRKRAFFICSKIGDIELPTATVSPDKYTSVYEALKGLDDTVPNQTDYTKPGEETIERMRHIPQGCNWRVLPRRLKTAGMKKPKASTHSSIYRRLRMDEPAWSVTNVRKSNITHYKLNRTLTVREAARLIGLPDSFVFLGKINKMQQQIANGVAVDVARAIASKIKTAITQFNIRNGFERFGVIG